MNRDSIARLLAVAAMTLVVGVGCQTSSSTQTDTPQPDSEWEESSTPSTTPSTTKAMADLQTVYFAFDSSEIRSDARSVLKGNSDVIGSASGGTITIEGHCDERGSEEYNLALGERRANAVKRYLVDLGVPSSRLRTVSFGEARPAVQGHDESAWRYNRRADFVN